MKHGTKKRLKVNIMYARVRSASSPGGDASPRRHLLIKARCLDKQIQYIFLFSYCQVGVSNPTWQCRREDASPPSENASPAHLYIYTREITPFMFFNTKRKKIAPIVCSFKAENVLLPCYSFPAKKSLKKVSFFKSLAYNDLRV